MKTKHTPGPWSVAQFDSFLAIKRADVSICRLSTFDKCNDDARTEADARLIAAAPELLSQLTSTLEFIKSLQLDAYDAGNLRLYTELQEEREHLETVIAKAEGRNE